MNNKKKNIPNKKYLKNWINKIEKKIKIYVIIKNKYKIKLINKKFKKIYLVTNILIFKKIKNIFICPEYIFIQSQNIKNKKLIFWCQIIIHGILHIKGYNHKTNKNFLFMNKTEKKIIKKIFKSHI